MKAPDGGYETGRKARIPPAGGGVPQARSHLAFIRGGAAQQCGMNVYYDRAIDTRINSN